MVEDYVFLFIEMDMVLFCLILQQELDEELDSILDNRLVVDSKVEAIQNLV